MEHNKEDFEPRFGRSRSRPAKRGSYLGSVAAVTVPVEFSPKARGRFHGCRVGSGASLGRILRSRDRLHAFRTRRGIVKTRLVRLGGKGLAAAGAHMRYIQRDGVTRDGRPGQMYGPGSDDEDGKAFLERCDGDRHQFRFIVSTEDGADYEDLKPLTRRLMAQVEADLGTNLDWVAVDHYNTGHPHTHIMLRGKTDRGDNLVIAREYIAHGMRGRLAELVSIDLGLRSDMEIARKLTHDIDQERLTALDRRLVRRMDADRTIRPTSRDSRYQVLEAGRLQALGRLGLAQEVVPGRWRLADHMEAKLRALGERGDIIRMMQRELARNGRGHARNLRIHAVGEAHAPIVGCVAARGLSDEHADRHFLIIDGVDGHRHYVEAGSGEALGEVSAGSIVRFDPIQTRGRQIDMLSRFPLERLVRAEAATWLDKELVTERPVPVRGRGFGREVRRCLETRRQWLLTQGLVEQQDVTTTFRADLLAVLERRDIARAAQLLSQETGLDFAEARHGRVEGILSRRVDLVSGSYAMIERSRNFTLVPWRAVLDRQIGLPVSGMRREASIDWTFSRQREGPSVR